MINPLSSEERFEYALDIVLRDEGGYTNDKNDPGGETNFGITQKELDKCHVQLALPQNVKDLTREEASIYYKAVWWDKYNYNAIDNIIIATKLFDLAINMGALEAHKIAQEALTYNGYSRLKIDGILGIKTIGAINEMCLHGTMTDLLNDICEGAAWYYDHLVDKNPKLEKFLKGWLRRAAR